MSKYRILLFSVFSLLILYCVDVPIVQAASGPYDVPSDVRNKWDNIKGGKQYTNSTGKRLLYDVYSHKGIDDGYRVVNRNFGEGTRAYINFEGWSVLHGHAKHTYANNETYIVAQKVGGNETKIYSTQKRKSLSATEDLEYNNQGSGVYNECPDSARNKLADECNMRYNNVDFQAFIPIEELFPDITSQAKWRLYIVKKVNNRIIYDEMRVPFNFEELSYEGGEISLSSGLNANSLIMNNEGVLRRSYRSQTAESVRNELGDNRHFQVGRPYSMLKSEEGSTTVFYGVRSIHSNDRGETKYASSAYWMFGGDQATIEFVPDEQPPEHRSHGITQHRYKDGNDYWIQPNDDVDIRLRGYDKDSFLNRSVLRLDSGDADARVRYYYNEGRFDYWWTDNTIDINSAKRTYQSSTQRTREATWNVTAREHGHNYNVMYWHTDNANNSIGYSSTGMNLRVDGIEPQHQSHSIAGASYEKGNDYWMNSEDEVTVTFRQRDTDSGNKYQYLRLLDNNDGIDVRMRHNYSGDKNYMANVSGDAFIDDSITITSANRKEDSSYGTVEWKVLPHSHGKSFNVMYYYQDNVDNKTTSSDSYNYGDTNLNIRIDDNAPVVSFRDKDDKVNFLEREWHHSEVDVRLKFKDDDSGYDKSRYAWTKSTTKPKDSDWSDWTSSSNYVVNQSNFGEWNLHVQAIDNVGNTITTYEGLYKINQAPNVDFEYPDPLYEGDPLELVNISTDPEGHDMNAIWKITDPDGVVEEFNSWDVTIHDLSDPYNPQSKPGTYTVHLEVTDEYGAKDSIEKEINVIPLVIEGTVEHTERWREIHELLDNPENVFFSGERFILSSSVTNYPISNVDVTFRGTDVNNDPVEITEVLTESSSTDGIISYKGEIYEEFMADPNNKLKSETDVHFTFKAEWTNGVIKEDIVTIRIVDDVYDFYKLHKTN
ncbi:hypothetical protein [Oceanobacillus kimchii]|uniref:PKD domain-containing protein n=1 Tax=Oceanobacillus kimchii TaxID=746691 RepID=A0ABQ5TPE8_9BACI|nr:hypothetical protein [Oceanobacillus kimchii]GLO68266.1 hypothetical protein MACH08_40500 [Oceanobacillus kimchii]